MVINASFASFALLYFAIYEMIVARACEIQRRDFRKQSKLEYKDSENDLSSWSELS